MVEEREGSAKKAPEREPYEVPEDLYGIAGLLKTKKNLSLGIQEHKDYMARVIANIQGEIHKAEEETKQLDIAIKTYLSRRRDTKVNIPDIGTAYLTTRATTVEVVDPEVFAAWCIDEGLTTADVSAGKKRAKELIKPEFGGEIVSGCDVVPERKTVAVRYKK